MPLVRGCACIFVLHALITVGLCQGGPPLITDDPGTPGNKHWEINIAFTNTHFDFGKIYEAPHIDLNYGYGDNVQLKLEGPLTIFEGSTARFASLADTNWGVKWRFLNENNKRPSVSTYPQLLVITNREFGQLGVTDPGTDLYLPLEVMKSFGKFLLDMDGGVLFRQFSESQFSSGICGEFDVNEHLALLGEVHAITSTSFVEDQLVWNLGFKQDVSKGAPILFSAERSFRRQGGDDPGFMLYVGMQIRV